MPFANTVTGSERKIPSHAVYQIEFERDAVLQALLNSGRLTQTEILRSDLVERELSLVIAEWAERVNNE